MDVGTRLGHYTITAKLGEGGMGQVFRAEDTNLKREVAIKVLPPQLAGDADRMARLEREAQLLAQLDHANIAAIHGLESADDGTRFLVMQLAEGQDLHQRLDAGPMSVDEALRIALQVARALESAHERGVVHRDLKPANIMVGDDGTVKLLDFGLAKAFASDGMSGSLEISASPTMMEATAAGVILGTAGYMSPEQARGRSVDRRTDVWAFGCVMYEMLTAQRVFGGETATDVLGAIVHRDPEWELLPSDTPRRIRALLHRCLRKDMDRRIQAIGDARVSIEEYLEDPEAAESILDDGAEPPIGTRPWLPWALAGALGLAFVMSMIVGAEGAPEKAPTLRLDMMIGVEDELRDTSLGSSMIVSPDGRQIVVVTGTSAQATEVRIRRLDQADVEVLATGALYNPFFSPDSNWVGFASPSALMKVPATGGTPLEFVAVNRSRGATWTDDNEVVFARDPASPLELVSADGGDARPLTEFDATTEEVTHRWPQFVTGTRKVIFTAHTNTVGAFDAASIQAVDIDTGEKTILYRGGYYGRYVKSGHLLFMSDGTLFAIPLDIDSMEIVGSAVPVAEAVADDPGEGGGQYGVSENGILVHRAGSSVPVAYPAIWLDRDGDMAPLLPEERAYVEARVSPDGNRVAMTELNADNWDVWVYDIQRGTRTRITFEPGIEGPAVWSPDGTELIYSSDATGSDELYRKRSDGSGNATQITTEEVQLFVSDWSPDGRYAIMLRGGTEDADSGWFAGADLGVLDLESEDATVRPFVATRFQESEASFSSDGRWVAYQSNESGESEIYVQPFPEGEGRWQVSDAGGGYARWSPNGSELFYRSADGIMVVEISAQGGTFSATRPRLLVTGNFLGGPGGLGMDGNTFADYDVAPDGRFVMFPSAERTNGGVQLARVVVNWFPELTRVAPRR
ncbi:MAG: protein kinase [Acidobacteria bacterium]|nr:protein kinase [Acidobacteriota bacterium]